MFCRICGKELHENAFVCPDCGCLVDDGAKVKKSPKKETLTEAKGDKALKSFLIVAFIFAMLSLTLTLASIIYPEFVDLIYSNFTARNFETSASAFPALIFGVVALSMSIVSFVLGLKKEDGALKMIAILMFIFCIFICAIGVVAFVNCELV